MRREISDARNPNRRNGGSSICSEEAQRLRPPPAAAGDDSYGGGGCRGLCTAPANPSYSCRRLLSSSGASQSPSNNAKHPLHSARPAPWPRQELRKHLTQIEVKKRELFDMLGQLDIRCPSIHKIAGKHRKLIYTLFWHVDANPDYPLWSMYQRRKRLYNSLQIGVPILSGIGFIAYHENEKRRK